MSFNKFKKTSFCGVGEKHHSATTNFPGDITQNKKLVGLLKYQEVLVDVQLIKEISHL